MAYAVYTTESFEKEIEKLSEADKTIIQKIFLQLKDNPYAGDQIRYRFFREKRIREKRLYFLVYDDLSAVLVVAFGSKKAQQETIDEIIKFLPEYKKYLENLLKQ
jgi:mRNA-degrading endonuclease RelE of RelBE toxin-antitoxin system